MSEITTTFVTNPNAPQVQTVDLSSAPAPVELPVTKDITAEVKAPAETPVVEDPKFSRKFNALSKKEAAIRAKEQSLKAQEKAYNDYQASLAQAKANPLELLKAHGTTLEDLIAYAIEPEHKAPTKEDKLAETVAQIQAKVTEYEEEGKRYQEQVKEHKRQETLAAINNDIKTFIDSNSDTYELIKLNKVENEVWQIIEQTYLESEGKVTLTQEQAALMLEKQLELEAEEDAARIEAYKKTKRFKARNSAADKEKSKPPVSHQVSTTELVSKLSPTLTNHSVSIGVAEPKRHLTADESLKEAAKLLKWK